MICKYNNNKKSNKNIQFQQQKFFTGLTSISPTKLIYDDQTTNTNATHTSRHRSVSMLKCNCFQSLSYCQFPQYY